jgi:hypothetical protein
MRRAPQDFRSCFYCSQLDGAMANNSYNESNPPHSKLISALAPRDDSIAQVLRTKRKPSSQKVCQPCRLRKVKCTYDTPCEPCVKRGHSDLCQLPPDQSFQPPAKRTLLELSSPSSSDDSAVLSAINLLRQEISDVQYNLSTVNNSISLLRNDLEQLRAPTQIQRNPDPIPKQSASNTTVQSTDSTAAVLGIAASNDEEGATIYLGGNSVPAMLVDLADSGYSERAAHDILGKSVLPVFGLDNETATYPFVDLWGIPHGSIKRIEMLCKLLPSTNSDCLHTFRLYRDTAHAIYPGIVDIVQFEGDLLSFLRQRDNTTPEVQPGPLQSQKVYGKDLHWLGLFFAVLASGAQCSQAPRKERQMNSQVYSKILARSILIECDSNKYRSLLCL